MGKLETVGLIGLLAVGGYVGYRAYKAVKGVSDYVVGAEKAAGVGYDAIAGGGAVSQATGGAISPETGKSLLPIIITPNPLTEFDFFKNFAGDIQNYFSDMFRKPTETQKIDTTMQVEGGGVRGGPAYGGEIVIPAEKTLKTTVPAEVFDRLKSEAKPYYNRGAFQTPPPATRSTAPAVGGGTVTEYRVKDTLGPSGYAYVTPSTGPAVDYGAINAASKKSLNTKK